MQLIRYGDLVFQADFRHATRDDGSAFSLTRQERALILQLARQPRQIVSRGQLLEGLGDMAGDLNERNIDYLVNRLRKRLGDNAKEPRFIATQYGEGYIWIAPPIELGPTSAFLLIGPVYGLGQDADAKAVVSRLAHHIDIALPSDRKVVYMPQWRFGPDTAQEIAHSLEISLLPEDGCLHMALILKSGCSNTPIAPFRLTLSMTSGDGEFKSFAESLTHAIWAHAALHNSEASTPTDPPLLLRLHDAAMLLTGSIESWRHNAQQLQKAYDDNPDDPSVAVLLALNRYAQLIQKPLSPEEPPLTDEQWSKEEDHIEQLALEALSKARHEPQLLLGIAKVLCFIDRGYLKLAAELADEAFERSTAFAAAFSMKGQIAACRGDIDQALDLYDRAIELSEAGSQFHIYLLVVKAVALLAGDRRAEVAQVAAELSAIDPVSRGWIALVFISPKVQQIPTALSLVPMEAGRRMLTYIHRTAARQFEQRHHRRNVLHGLAVQLSRVHGSEVIPENLKEYFPKLSSAGTNSQ